MSDQVISRADLRSIERSLDSMDGRLSSLAVSNDDLRLALDDLREEFAAFVREDAKQKQLQLAETRLVKVRQELEERFGYYAEVRRRATGILQAVDEALVTHDTVQSATEEMMISAPKYWLAPALVALAAWIRDQRPLAERALGEALRRDDYKTSLYFALVLRRYDRRAAAVTWLQRFYAHQTPTALDREFVVLLDAVANGVFGPEARTVTGRHAAEWLAQLSERAGFVEAQEQRWAQAIVALTPNQLPSEYPVLEKYSPTWPALLDSLRAAHLNGRLRDYFGGIFDGEIVASPRLSEEVDQLLQKLVTEYDDEEQPLRAKERELEAIVDSDGDVDDARKRVEAERHAFDDKADFAGLLTNAAMHPEISGATRATQRFAVALSREWVVGAYDAVAARARATHPATLALKVDTWEGTLSDGSEEGALIESVNAHFAAREKAELEKLSDTGLAKAGIVLGVMGIVLGIALGVNWLVIFIGFAMLVAGGISVRGRPAARQAVRDHIAAQRTEAERIVRAAVAEAVDALAELAREDARAEDTRGYLLALSPDQYTLARPSDGRAVLV